MHDEHVDAETAALYLQDVTPLWRAFWFHMHLMAKNLRELAVGLYTISDEVFAYHVGGEKNDLQRWVQEVIGDATLAQSLSHVKSQREAAETVAARVAVLEKARG